MPSSQAHISDWKDGFLFVGNNLALDFLNTRPVIDGEPRELLPDFPSLLRWFRAIELVDRSTAAGLEKQFAGTHQAQRSLGAMRDFREDLRQQIQRWEKGEALQPAAVARLNDLLRRYPLPARLTQSGKTWALSDAFVPETPEDLFAPVARSAAWLLARADRSRIRQCDACVLHFLDTSKKGTRRWCSMRMCGNRLKVAAYQARLREGS